MYLLDATCHEPSALPSSCRDRLVSLSRRGASHRRRVRLGHWPSVRWAPQRRVRLGARGERRRTCKPPQLLHCPASRHPGPPRHPGAPTLARHPSGGPAPAGGLRRPTPESRTPPPPSPHADGRGGAGRDGRERGVRRRRRRDPAAARRRARAPRGAGARRRARSRRRASAAGRRSADRPGPRTRTPGAGAGPRASGKRRRRPRVGRGRRRHDGRSPTGPRGEEPAALTLHAQQTMLEPATLEVRLELAPDERRPPARPVRPARPRQEGREVGRDGPVEHRLLGLAALVGRRGGA